MPISILTAEGLAKLLQKIKTVFATKTELTAVNENLTEQLTSQSASAEENFVHKSGNETIAGVKTFSEPINGTVSAYKVQNPADDSAVNSVPLTFRGTIDVSRSCKTAFAPASAITIEYCTDGSTWTDYGASDADKQKLFAMIRGVNFTLGKGTAGGTSQMTTGCKLRVTVAPTDRYANADTLYLWLCAYDHTMKVDIERSTIGNKTAFTKIRNGVPIAGWSGANVISFPIGQYGGGSGQTANNYAYRFTFYCTGISSNKTYYPTVSDIRLYGPQAWNVSNPLMYNDHLYSWDESKNATFPAGVTATSFTGNLTGTADKATQDASGNTITSYYCNLSGAQTVSGKKTFTGGVDIYSGLQGQAASLNIRSNYNSDEGGQINFFAPDNGITYNGFFIDNYRGQLRLIGLPSADGTTKTGNGTALYIDPYAKTITGGYTFTGALSGNASTATKLAAARTISLGGFMTGSANFDGSANITITATHRSCLVGQSGSTTTNPWYKFASFTVNTANDDIEAVFLVDSTYATHWSGILRAHVRTNGDKTITVGNCTLAWLVHTGFTPADFVMVIPTAASGTVELWTKIATAWRFVRFTVLSEGSRTTTNARWTLYNASSAGQQASIPTAGTQKASVVSGAVNTAVSTTSDARLKKDISDIPDSVLDDWDNVKWKQFRMKSDDADAPFHSGLVAQEANEALKTEDYSAVQFSESSEFEDGKEWHVSYNEALAIEAAYLRRRCRKLEKSLQDAFDRISALELKGD